MKRIRVSLAISIDASGNVMETNAEDDVFILAPDDIYACRSIPKFSISNKL